MAKKDCAHIKSNLQGCPCSYPGCPRKGMCCECLRYHLTMDQLPACCFPADVEKTYDRSFQRFAQIHHVPKE